MPGEILISGVGDPVVAVELPFSGDLGDILIDALEILKAKRIADRVCAVHPTHCMSTTVDGIIVHVDGILGTLMINEMEVLGPALGEHGAPVLTYLRAFKGT